MKNLYSILGISHESSLEEIKKAYYFLALKYHPDRNKSEGAAKKFREVNTAYSILSDFSKRREYDLRLEKVKIEYQKAQKKAQKPKQQKVNKNEVDYFLDTLDVISETIRSSFRYAKKFNDMFGGF